MVHGMVEERRVAGVDPQLPGVAAPAGARGRDAEHHVPYVEAPHDGRRQTYGGQFTEGTLVARAEAHGGVLLSVSRAKDRTDPNLHTATVMLGLVPPARGTVAADACPVRCYRFTFGLGPTAWTGPP